MDSCYLRCFFAVHELHCLLGVLTLCATHGAQVVIQHKAVITCVEVTADGSMVVSGSRDTNVIVWDTNVAEFGAPSSSSSARVQRRLPIKCVPRA